MFLLYVYTKNLISTIEFIKTNITLLLYLCTLSATVLIITIITKKIKKQKK